jgi:signal peptidase I
LKILGAALLAVIIGVTAYVMVCNMRGKVAEIFGRSIMKVVSGSMEPSIHKGDYILINKIDPAKLEVGDVICFYSEDSEIYGMPNTHRIAALTDGGFVTKGDANSTEDSVTVSYDRVIGIYSGKVRFLRWVNSFASGKKLLMVLVIIPMSAIAFYELVTIARIKTENTEEERKAAAEEREKKIREAIDKEKAKLYENGLQQESEVSMSDESGKDNES